MGIVLAGLLMTVVVVAFILHPIVMQKHAPTERGREEVTEAQARKRIALMALRDAEYDFATGKLDQEDYESLRAELATEALKAIEVEEAERKVEIAAVRAEARHPGAIELQELEQEIEVYRARLRTALACPSCGQLNEESSRFCGHCGAKLVLPTEASAAETGTKT